MSARFPSILRQTSLVAAALIAAAPGVASAARLKVASVTSSSEYASSDPSVSYQARLLTDGKAGTSWVEGDSGGGLGSWVELDLGGPHAVNKIEVWGGMWYSSEYWQRGNRPKQLQAKFSDGSTVDFDLTDSQTVQTLNLPKPVTTSTVRLTVKALYNGTTWQDTGISEIMVYDDQPEPQVRPNTITASSTTPADADGSYEAKNVGDGLADTIWCEGNKTGDGTGEWLMFDFGAAHQVAALNLINGMGGSFSLFMKANRASSATLTFSDGLTAPVVIKPTMTPQVITFPSKSTSSVKMTFTGVVKGKEFNDLCISEAYFQ
jgi:hypothetical protein